MHAVLPRFETEDTILILANPFRKPYERSKINTSKEILEGKIIFE